MTMVVMGEMMLMMILMMPGVMAMTMTAIRPLREGNSPTDFSLPELFFSLSSFCLVEAAEKFLVDAPDVFRSRVKNTPKGRRRGATGTRAGPCPLLLAPSPPSGSVTYFLKYYSLNFSGIFWASEIRCFDRYFSS